MVGVTVEVVGGQEVVVGSEVGTVVGVGAVEVMGAMGAMGARGRLGAQNTRRPVCLDLQVKYGADSLQTSSLSEKHIEADQDKKKTFTCKAQREKGLAIHQSIIHHAHD